MIAKSTPEERAEARYKFVDTETNKRHDDFNDRQVERRIVFATCIREEVEPLEATNASLTEENAKLRALVQELVDAICLPIISVDVKIEHLKQVQSAVAAANEQGFVPTNTTEHNG